MMAVRKVRRGNFILHLIMAAEFHGYTHRAVLVHTTLPANLQSCYRLITSLEEIKLKFCHRCFVNATRTGLDIYVVQ